MSEFKEIPGYENYEITKNGVIRNKKTGKILKQSLKNKYMTIALRLNNRYKYHNTHRLVAMSWLGLPENYKKLQVAHNDGNSFNNHVDNLRWTTPKENTHDKYEHGGFVNVKNGESHHNAKLNRSLVIKLRNEIRYGNTNCKELSYKYKIPHVTIYDAVVGKSWKSVNNDSAPVNLAGRQYAPKWR